MIQRASAFVIQSIIIINSKSIVITPDDDITKVETLKALKTMGL